MSTRFVRACGTVATIAGAAGLAGWSGRLARRHDARRLASDLERADGRFWARLQVQLEVARRHDRRFTITTTELDRHDRRLVLAECERRIRTLDAVTLIDHRLVGLWWNSDGAAAAIAIARLTADGVLPSDAATGAATFPDDGLTAASLMDAAVRSCASEDAAWPRDLRPVPDLDRPSREVAAR